MTRRRVVITGATGAVGTALLEKLSAGDTGYDLHAIACRPPPSSVYPLAEWHQVDLADPRAVTRLQRLFADQTPILWRRKAIRKFSAESCLN